MTDFALWDEAHSGVDPREPDATSSQSLTPALTDDELIVALDNTLADYVLVCRYPSNNTPNAGDKIRDRMSELSQEMASRGMTYSHDKAAAAARRINAR